MHAVINGVYESLLQNSSYLLNQSMTGFSTHRMFALQCTSYQALYSKFGFAAGTGSLGALRLKLFFWGSLSEGCCCVSPKISPNTTFLTPRPHLFEFEFIQIHQLEHDLWNLKQRFFSQDRPKSALFEPLYNTTPLDCSHLRTPCLPILSSRLISFHLKSPLPYQRVTPSVPCKRMTTTLAS